MREPDLTGACRAWRVKNTPEAQAGHVREWGYEDSTIDNWLVNGPFHPLWSWWMVAVVHLRPIPGAPPPNLQYPEAEYEFMILSMDPGGEHREGEAKERPTEPDVDGFEATGDGVRYLPGFLQPPDAVVQFHGVDDDEAREVCQLAVNAIVSGQASPDSDWRSWWEKAIPNTVKHIRGEPH